MDIAGTQCARARESVSADLDRELQELDLRRLQAHLRVCADCSTWAEHVKATTVQLREAPFEALRGVAVELPPRGRRTWRVGAALAIAPAAALAAGIAVFLGGTQHSLLAGQRTAGSQWTSNTYVSPTGRDLMYNGQGIDMYMPPSLRQIFQAV